MTHDTSPPILIDIEASSLGDASYPIEIAFGNSAVEIDSRLIDPSGVASWVDWSRKAESIHGISRAMLHKKGVTPRAAARWLNEELAGKEIATDAPDYDLHWLDTLFDAVQVKRRFKLAGLNDLIRLRLDSRLTDRDIRDLRDKFVLGHGEPPHRAAGDVAWLRAFWHSLASETCLARPFEDT